MFTLPNILYIHLRNIYLFREIQTHMMHLDKTIKANKFILIYLGNSCNNILGLKINLHLIVLILEIVFH